MFHVHVVGSSESLSAAPISTPALFAQLVYRTHRLLPPSSSSTESIGGVHISASTLASTAGGCAVDTTPIDPLLGQAFGSNSDAAVLEMIAAWVAGSGAAPATSPAAASEEEGDAASLQELLASIEPYPFFCSSFFEVARRFRRDSSSQQEDNQSPPPPAFDVILCTDAEAFDDICGWYAAAAASSSAEETLVENCARPHRCVIAHIRSEQRSRLPMLYSSLTSSLAAVFVGQPPDSCRGGWVHLVDGLMQKLQALRSCEILYSIAG